MKTIAISRVYHLGTMNPKDKGHGSHEGSGLSVSLHPDAWARIHPPLSGQPLWTLKKKKSKFLDAIALLANAPERETLVQWGLRNSLIERSTLWETCIGYDEDDSPRFILANSIEEAKNEAYSEDGIRKIDGVIATDKLRKATLNDADPAIVLDLLLPLYAELMADLDGVWWAEKLAPCLYSAPRGVIPASKVHLWEATNTA